MRDTDAPASVLLVKLSSLGDVVHALPLIEALRRGLGQNATVSWAVRSRFASLVRGNPHVDALYELRGSGAGGIWDIGRSLGRQQFDIALDAQGLLVSGLVTRLSAAPRRIGFDRNRECNALFLTDAIVPGRDRRHIVDVLMGFCDALGVPRIPARPQDYLIEGERERAEFLLTEDKRAAGPVVGCIIGASTVDKTWPTDRWADAAARIAGSGARVALLGGAGETQAASDIVAASPAGSIAVNLVGRTPLPVLASVLAKCNVVIGGDSGPTHLAVAVGTPVVGIYGVTDPARTGPDWGNGRSIVLDYAEADAPPAARRPRHGALPDALSRIPAEAVAFAALSLLSEGAGDATG